jgi:putative hemolysin
MSNIWLELVLIAVAIVANGFFAASEIALVSSRTSRLAQMREASVRGAAAALALKKSPDAFLATIQIAITLVGTLASAVGGATAVRALTPWIASLELPGMADWAEPLALAIVVVALTYASLVIGELAPKALALRNPEAVACAVARPILWLSRLSSGLVRLLTVSSGVVLRLLGQGPVPEAAAVSEEEVKYFLREGTARGIFEKVEEELVHNVFEFADTTVREIMVPRHSILGMELSTPPDQVLRRAVEIGHTRIPVYRDSIEHPEGVVIIKDLLRAAASGRPPSLPELLHPPLFVPEFARVSALLKEFERTRQNLAIVVDEYGGVTGLVTLEDVLEEIVGEIREEREPTSLPGVTRLPDGSYVLDGTVEVWQVRETLGLPVPESSEYNTVAGFIIHALGSIPAPGTSVVGGGCRFTVVDMEGPRIARVKVQREAR